MMLLLLLLLLPTALGTLTYDLLIYGSTPSGVMAAKGFRDAAGPTPTILLLDPGSRVGGMSSGGLGNSDVRTWGTVGGAALDFFIRNARLYDPNATHPYGLLEPHLALGLFTDTLAAANATVISGVGGIGGVSKEGPSLFTITTLDGTAFSSRYFVDASYEGDLLAAAGASFELGRESRAAYGESPAGRLGNNYSFVLPINPYGPDGALLPLMSTSPFAGEGGSDKVLQAYTFRLCATNISSLMRPFPAPSAFKSGDFELFRRWVAAAPPLLSSFFGYAFPIPWLAGKGKNGTGKQEECCKFDFNSDFTVSSDFVGGSIRWPGANASERAGIWEAHRQYMLGLFHVLQYDPATPPQVRAEALQWGLCSDEFQDTAGWPSQLYVREGRRLVGESVFTQVQLNRGEAPNNDSVGLGSYAMDVHHVERVPCIPAHPPLPPGPFPGPFPPHAPTCTMVQPRDPRPPPGTPVWVAMEGHGGDISAPDLVFELPYSLLLPQRAQATNLLVPVAVSASHAAFNSLRLEAQWMILGQAAGVAAALAGKGGGAAAAAAAVQDVSVEALQAELIAQGALLHWPHPAAVGGGSDAASESNSSSPPLPPPCNIYLSLAGSDGEGLGLNVDTPLSSLPTAHAAALSALASGTCAAVTVHVGPGEWAGPWVFPPAPRASITYKGSGAGSSSSSGSKDSTTPLPPTVITGGILVGNFTSGGGPSAGLWTAWVPAGTNASQLFVGGVRRPRARAPNVVGDPGSAGDAYSAASTFAWDSALCPNCTSAPTAPINGQGLVYAAGDAISPDWDFTGAEVTAFTSPWSACVTGVSSLWPANRTLLFQGRGCSIYGLAAFPGYETGKRWLVANVRGALDAPGEWYLDSTTGLLEYFPLPGETLQGFTATLAHRGSLLVVSQDGLAFEDLTVAYADVDARGGSSGMSSFAQSGAVEIAASGVALQRLTVAHTGANCIVLRPNVTGFLLGNSTLLDCGGHGVYMDTQDQASDVLITDTRIHGVGFLYLSQPTGILLNGGTNVSAVHNEVVNSSYTGISVAWLHGDPMPLTPAPFRFNVSFNRVDRFGLGILSDFAGVRVAINNGDECFLSNRCYIPTLVQNNLITGGRHFSYGADGLYTDNAVAGVSMLDNIVGDVDGMGFQPHCGINNTLSNSLIYNARALRSGNCTYPPSNQHPTAVIDGCLGGWRNANGSTIPAPFSAAVERSIIVTTRCGLYGITGLWPNPGPGYPGAYSSANFSADSNVYFAAQGALPLTFPLNVTLEEWRAASGNDAQSVINDPRLKDPERGDFTVLPDSPAWALGWHAIDTTLVGPH